MSVFLNNAFDFIKNFLSTVQLKDILDVLIVAYLVYKALAFINKTRAQQLVKGILFLLVLMQLADLFKLDTLSFIMKNTMELGLLAIIIVFQPELRKALEHVGRSKIGLMNVFHADSKERAEEMNKTIEQVVTAVEELSETKTGALIVFERRTKLGDIVDTGTVINSDTTSALILNVFFKNTPLHDGALIIRDARMYSAACFLPLSQNKAISRELGTRHRAALGISEVSDSVTLVVSEETGKISLAVDGVLKRNLSVETLKKALSMYLMAEFENEKNDDKKKVK